MLQKHQLAPVDEEMTIEDFEKIGFHYDSLREELRNPDLEVVIRPNIVRDGSRRYIGFWMERTHVTFFDTKEQFDRAKKLNMSCNLTKENG